MISDMTFNSELFEKPQHESKKRRNEQSNKWINILEDEDSNSSPSLNRRGGQNLLQSTKQSNFKSNKFESLDIEFLRNNLSECSNNELNSMYHRSNDMMDFTNKDAESSFSCSSDYSS